MSKPSRLYVDAPLSAGVAVPLPPDQSHYILNVMRRSDGDPVLLFNGRDGEWVGHVRRSGKRTAEIDVSALTRPQAAPADIHYCFAPIKRARLDFIAQKATELGAAALKPVLSRYTVAERVKTERLRANAVEAAEQCGVLWVPDVSEPEPLDRFLSAFDPGRTLVFCDEDAPIHDPIAALGSIAPGPLAVLIGPEGGFSEEERQQLRALSHVLPLSLGPRIMRADTAGIAAMTLVQAVLGDWT